MDGDEKPADEAPAAHPDFSAEELELARSLRRLFPLEQEQLPPLFIETLAAERSAWVAPHGLEQRVTYRVFRRLRLPRHLPWLQAPVLNSRPHWPRPATRRTALSTLLALVLLSLVTVAPSFAQGLHLLMGQTGSQGAPGYPVDTFAPQGQVSYLPISEVRKLVPFTTYWLGEAPGAYQFQQLLLHLGQSWADGPVIELQYKLAENAGSRQLLVREFRPTGATVLQVVAQKAAHPARVGNQQAIYIDGQWAHQRQGILWQYGTQAELLFQANGLIFWITADQRAGAGKAMLEALAQTLQPLYLTQPRPRLAELMLPANAQAAAALSPASLGEVITLIPAGVSSETGAAVYIALGSPPDAMN